MAPLDAMSDGELSNGDAVIVWNRLATVDQTLDGEKTRVRFEDTGAQAWPTDDKIDRRGVQA